MMTAAYVDLQACATACRTHLGPWATRGKCTTMSRLRRTAPEHVVRGASEDGLRVQYENEARREAPRNRALDQTTDFEFTDHDVRPVSRRLDMLQQGDAGTGADANN